MTEQVKAVVGECQAKSGPKQFEVKLDSAQLKDIFGYGSFCKSLRYGACLSLCDVCPPLEDMQHDQQHLLHADLGVCLVFLSNAAHTFVPQRGLMHAHFAFVHMHRSVAVCQQCCRACAC